jgi:hypothetical protein
MRVNKKISSVVLVATVFVLGAFETRLSAETSVRNDQWSVRVNNVEPGDVNLDPAFRVAIYENLLAELAKADRFKQVFRSGDRNATNASALLVLKTIVESYTPGSETRRAVTTVSGATKLKVRCQLLSPEGRVIWERTVDGNVRFFGANLRATHNLAHNVVNSIKQSTLPPPTAQASASGN